MCIKEPTDVLTIKIDEKAYKAIEQRAGGGLIGDQAARILAAYACIPEPVRGEHDWMAFKAFPFRRVSEHIDNESYRLVMVSLRRARGRLVRCWRFGGHWWRQVCQKALRQ